METDDKKLLNLEKLKNAQILKIVNIATLVSVAMILFYGLGAYKHFKEIKKLK
jgi:hypothetical protein